VSRQSVGKGKGKSTFVPDDLNTKKELALVMYDHMLCSNLQQHKQAHVT